MKTAVVLFTRDLRVRDNPALAAACEQADLVIPLFTVDARLMTVAPNRARFLLESLADLREGLRARGGDLVVRSGKAEAEVVRLATQASAETVFVAGDVSRYAARRQEALARECARHRLDLRVTQGVTVVPPGELRAAGADHYKVSHATHLDPARPCAFTVTRVISEMLFSVRSTG